MSTTLRLLLSVTALLATCPVAATLLFHDSFESGTSGWDLQNAALVVDTAGGHSLRAEPTSASPGIPARMVRRFSATGWVLFEYTFRRPSANATRPATLIFTDGLRRDTAKAGIGATIIQQHEYFVHQFADTGNAIAFEEYFVASPAWLEVDDLRAFSLDPAEKLDPVTYLDSVDRSPVGIFCTNCPEGARRVTYHNIPTPHSVLVVHVSPPRTSQIIAFGSLPEWVATGVWPWVLPAYQLCAGFYHQESALDIWFDFADSGVVFGPTELSVFNVDLPALAVHQAPLPRALHSSSRPTASAMSFDLVGRLIHPTSPGMYLRQLGTGPSALVRMR